MYKFSSYIWALSLENLPICLINKFSHKWYSEEDLRFKLRFDKFRHNSKQTFTCSKLASKRKKNARKCWEVSPKLMIRHQNNVTNLVTLLSIFQTFSWCFYFWLWTSKCFLDSLQKITASWHLTDLTSKEMQ